MATKEVLKERARIAALLSRCLRDPMFERDFLAYAEVSSDGDIPAIVAAPSESAALTLHRLESLHVNVATLATYADDRLWVSFFRQSSDNKDAFDIAGEITVDEWVQMDEDDGPSRAYAINATEFKDSMSAVFSGLSMDSLAPKADA